MVDAGQSPDLRRRRVTATGKPPEKLLICVNAIGNAEKPCCADRGSKEMHRALVDGVAARRINIRVETIVCLNKCHFGPSMRLAPGGRFILGKTLADIPALLDALEAECGRRPAVADPFADGAFPGG